MEIDESLILHIDLLATADTIHLANNLVAAYRNAVAEYQRTDEPSYQMIAREAEDSLRILLTQLRFRQAGIQI